MTSEAWDGGAHLLVEGETDVCEGYAQIFRLILCCEEPMLHDEKMV